MHNCVPGMHVNWLDTVNIIITVVYVYMYVHVAQLLSFNQYSCRYLCCTCINEKLLNDVESGPSPCYLISNEQFEQDIPHKYNI